MADTPGLSIPIRVTGLDDVKKSLSTTSEVAGVALRGVTTAAIRMNAGFLASQGAVGAATIALGNILPIYGAIKLGILAIGGAFDLMSTASNLAKQRIQEWNTIANNASSVSTDFYQRITKSAGGAKLSVDDLTTAFQKMNQATSDKLGGSDLQNQIAELQKAGNLSGNTGVNQLASANDSEEKFREIVGLINQAMQSGERLAALDISEKAFGPQITNALRADNGYLDQMLQRADAISKSQLISQEDIGRAVELKDRLDAAQQTLAEKWKPIQDDLASAGMNYHSAWVSITEDLASAVGYATDLYKALHQVPDWFANRIGGASIWSSITDATTTPESRAAAEQSLGISSNPADIGMVTANNSLRAALQNHTNVTRAMSEATTVQSAVRGDTSKAPTDQKADDTDAVDRAINSLRRLTEQREADTKAVGLSQGALAQLRAEAQETAAVQANGGKETAEQAAQFKTLEERAGAAADALAKAKINDQISFGKQTAFLDPEDVSVANQLKSVYGNDVPKALASTEAAAIKMNDSLKQIGTGFQSALTGPLVDFETGAKSASSALASFASSFEKTLLQMVNQELIVKPLLSGIGSIFGLGSTAAPSALPMPGSGSFIGPVAHADGGLISGPGGPRDDKVPAMLSNGEYVVNAAATTRHRSLLESINSGVPHFADGGFVGIVPRSLR